MIYKEKVIETDEIYDGKIVKLKVDTVKLADEKISKREIVEHSGGVAIVAINEDNNLILVKQYRIAADDFLIELPAGKLEPGEDPIDAIIRELKEETGYNCKQVKLLNKFYPTSGYSSEIIHLYYGHVFNQESQKLDEHEYIDIVELSPDQAYKMVKEGKIIDGKTIIGILNLMLMRQV